MKGKITTFKFSNLPKISKEAVALSKIFDRGSIDIETINLLLKQSLLGLDPINAQGLSLTIRSIDIEKKEFTLGLIGEHVVTLGGTFSQKDVPFVIAIHKRCVAELVYLLLGSKTEIPECKTELSPVEEGIFAFLVSAVFDGLEEHLTERLGGQLNLAPLNRELVVTDMFAHDSQLLNLTFDLKIKHVLKRMNILVAARKAMHLFEESMATDPNEELRLGLNRSKAFKVPVSVTLGQVELSTQQLQSLQIGDIVLLDSKSIKMDEEKLSGRVACLNQPGGNAAFYGELDLSKDGHYEIHLDDSSGASAIREPASNA